MSVTIEKIEELRNRAQISYEEAKILLEKHNGNLVDALIELEKNQRVHSTGCHRHCKEHSEKFSKLKKLFIKGNRTKFRITRKGEIIANIPLNYLILSLILSFHLMIITLMIIFITGCKMTIQKSQGEVVDVDDAIIDVAQKVKTSAENFADDINKSSGIDLSKEKKAEKSDEKGYNEHRAE